MTINILIAENHTVMCEGLQILLESESDLNVVSIAKNGREAVEISRQLNPDIVIMDIDMPEKNGILATREICTENPSCKVIGFSMLTANQYVTDMFQAGAVGYIPKESAFEELVTAIHSVLKGQMYLSPIISRTILTHFITNQNNENTSSISILSDRELEILQLIAEGKSSKEISLSLHISNNTVIRHRQNIMDKLELHNIADLTRYAIREGHIHV
ncbi:MAG: response regulator transcription factor [Sedimentisphaerales bacterium]|nr:response regulator transcription factor [Sedimentisphaerales bacterium]